MKRKRIMIFIGDIAIPFDYSSYLPKLPDCFSGSVIANLEGGITDTKTGHIQKAKLFNHPSVLDYLESLNVKVVSLANNHILDVHPSPSDTIKRLHNKGIAVCGAGDSIGEAANPCILHEDDREVVFLAFGWETIQCAAAKPRRAGVNPLKPNHVLKSVTAAKKTYPNATIILLMHWDYGLELYPQPAHRQLAFAAIENGANAIIGHHSHCVQGIEVYQNAPIVYCLGNWLLVEGYFFGNKINFPDFAKLQLAFEWNPIESRMICHWFEYQRKDHSILYLKSEALECSSQIKKLTPFNGMNHKEYTKWFRQNRRKKIFLPVYVHYKTPFTNWLKDVWVNLRHWLIRILVKFRLKGGSK